MNTQVVSVRALGIAVVIGLLACMPMVLHAQTTTSNELSATIRAQLLSDPRTSTLSEAQLNAMVDLLSQEAQKQGLTAKDVVWRPNPPAIGDGTTSATPSSLFSCDGSFTCLVDEAFGFVGPDTSIPFLLGMSSMGLIWILAEMLHRHRYPHIVVPPAAPVSGGM